MNYIGISFLALIPALLLCWYIYTKDRMEKEPFGLLAVLFIAGGVLYIPAIYTENALIKLFDEIFASKIEYSLTGVAEFASDGDLAAHSLLCGFIAIALIEEAAKWIVLYFITFRNKNFNHLFDGVVYAVFVSLGFAALENIRYAVMDGWDTFIMRSLTSVPGHMIFGIIMGICYTTWHTYLVAKRKEKILSADGRITVKKYCNSPFWLITSLILPIAVHGFYSFVEMYTSDIMTAIFYGLIVILFSVCFVFVRWLSAVDNEDDEVAYRLLTLKYPELKDQPDTTGDCTEGGRD